MRFVPVVLRVPVGMPRLVQLPHLLFAGKGVGDEVGALREEADQAVVPRIVDGALDGCGGVNARGIGRVGRLGHVEQTELEQAVAAVQFLRKLAVGRIANRHHCRQDNQAMSHENSPGIVLGVLVN